MNYQTTVAIIGAGPAGLYFASLCEEKKIDYLLLESNVRVGGQLVNLYPEKEIVDIPGISSILAKEYISLLKNKVDNQKIIYEFNASKFENNCIFAGDICVKAKYYIFATGLGFSSPRPLGIEGENTCKNILYHLRDYSFLKGKRVAIFGGGDSALDWAKTISSISDDVHLIHRRLEFRGNAETIKDCQNLNIHLPYVPDSAVISNGLAKEIIIKKVSDELNPERISIPVDYILVNYGNIAKSVDFGFESEGAFIKVDSNNKVVQNVFAIGDVCQYENKKRRIAPLLNECDKVFRLIQH